MASRFNKRISYVHTACIDCMVASSEHGTKTRQPEFPAGTGLGRPGRFPPRNPDPRGKPRIDSDSVQITDSKIRKGLIHPIIKSVAMLFGNRYPSRVYAPLYLFITIHALLDACFMPCANQRKKHTVKPPPALHPRLKRGAYLALTVRASQPGRPRWWSPSPDHMYRQPGSAPGAPGHQAEYASGYT